MRKTGKGEEKSEEEMSSKRSARKYEDLPSFCTHSGASGSPGGRSVLITKSSQGQNLFSSFPRDAKGHAKHG